MQDIARFPQYSCRDVGYQSGATPAFYPEGCYSKNHEVGSSDVVSYSGDSSDETNSDGSLCVEPLQNSLDVQQRCDPDDLSPSALFNQRQQLVESHQAPWMHDNNLHSTSQNCYADMNPVDLSLSARSEVTDSQVYGAIQKPHQYQRYTDASSWFSGHHVTPVPHHSVVPAYQDAYSNASVPDEAWSPGNGPVQHRCNCRQSCSICCFSSVSRAPQLQRFQPNRSVQATSPESEAMAVKRKKASIQERKRVKSVNEAIQMLKRYIPFEKQRHHKMCKLKILRFAAEYIQELTDLVASVDRAESQTSSNSSSPMDPNTHENDYKMLFPWLGDSRVNGH